MNKLLQSITNVLTYTYSKESHKTVVNLGYGIDDNCCRCTGASIASFCINNPKINFTFHILGSNLSNISKDNFKKLAQSYSSNIIIHEIDTSYLNSIKLPTKTGLPLPTYFRFILPLILKDLDKIFYIDSDIICRNSAEELFNISLGDNIIGAVEENDERIRNWCNELNIPHHKYFNAGMLAINVPKWNEYNIFDKLIDIVPKNHDKFPFLDQDALNFILTGKILYLKDKFNCQNWCYWKTHDSKNIASDDISVIHFGSYPKPWGLAWPSSEYYNSFNASIYSSYEALTPWKDYPLEKPKYYKEMKRYAKYLLKKGHIAQSIKWYINYSIKKISKKIQ